MPHSSCLHIFDNFPDSPWTKETAWLQSDGGPDVLLAGVVLHDDGQALLVPLLPQHGPAALGVARDRQCVGDVVAHQLAPDGREASEVLVGLVLLPQDPRGDKQRVGEGSSEPSLSGGSDTLRHSKIESVCHNHSLFQFHEKLIRFDL